MKWYIMLQTKHNDTRGINEKSRGYVWSTGIEPRIVRSSGRTSTYWFDSLWSDESEPIGCVDTYEELRNVMKKWHPISDKLYREELTTKKRNDKIIEKARKFFAKHTNPVVRNANTQT